MVALFQDVRESRLLVRFAMVKKDLSMMRGILGQAKFCGSGTANAPSIYDLFLTILMRWATVGGHGLPREGNKE